MVMCYYLISMVLVWYDFVINGVISIRDMIMSVIELLLVMCMLISIFSNLYEKKIKMKVMIFCVIF